MKTRTILKIESKKKKTKKKKLYLPVILRLESNQMYLVEYCI